MHELAPRRGAEARRGQGPKLDSSPHRSLQHYSCTWQLFEKRKQVRCGVRHLAEETACDRKR